MVGEWKPIDDSTPRGRVLMTKIDGDAGARNEQALWQSKDPGMRLWFVPSGDVYVYYRPTHWRELTESEIDQQTEAIRQRSDAARRECITALERLYP